MTITDVKECAIDRSRVVVHIRPFKLLKTLYGSCFMPARKPVPINSEFRAEEVVRTISNDDYLLLLCHLTVQCTVRSLVNIT